MKLYDSLEGKLWECVILLHSSSPGSGFNVFLPRKWTRQLSAYVFLFRSKRPTDSGAAKLWLTSPSPWPCDHSRVNSDKSIFTRATDKNNLVGTTAAWTITHIVLNSQSCCHRVLFTHHGLYSQIRKTGHLQQKCLKVLQHSLKTVTATCTSNSLLLLGWLYIICKWLFYFPLYDCSSLVTKCVFKHIFVFCMSTYYILHCNAAVWSPGQVSRQDNKVSLILSYLVQNQKHFVFLIV